MFCCKECFTDVEIKSIIEGKNIKGSCDFCGKHDVYVYEIGKDSTISELFDGILDIYTPVSTLPEDFPHEHIDLIKNILSSNWHIFNLDPDSTYRLLTSICADRYNEQPELFNMPVGIKQIQDKDFLAENSILRNNCWEDFVEGIKRKNRFHGHYINLDKLLIFLRCAVKNRCKGEVLYRSRICPDKKGYKPKDMGAPPSLNAKGGRVNPNGISVLYLSDSKETTLYEIRAGVYDFVTVGSFELLKDIEIVNLAGVDQISPFIGINYGFDFIQFAINIEHLSMLAQEIAKPIRNDNALDYLPTQYICDYIHSQGFDGIEYISTMSKIGSNLAVFDPDLFICTSTKAYDIQSISYSYEPL